MVYNTDIQRVGKNRTKKKEEGQILVHKVKTLLLES